MPTLNEFLEKALDEVKLVEGMKRDWKNDPWGARNDLVARLSILQNRISDISPSETMFFYNKNQKHINEIGKKLTALDKGISKLEDIAKK